MGRYLFIGAALLAGFSAAPAHAQEEILGTWRDAKDSVHVRTARCGDRVCGVVVWATERAKASARRGGTPNLIGATVFRDFKQEKPNQWRGRVFVPDRGVTFSGTISLVGRNELRGTGCLIGRIGCKSRTWTRVE